MDKMLCRNNLGIIGKWGARFLLGVVVATFVLAPIAYASETKLKLDLSPINKINEATAPINNVFSSVQRIFKLGQSINGTPISISSGSSQDTDFSKFFSSSRITTNDVTSFLKEAVKTGTNLTILIVSITLQVLKGLLGVLR